MTRIHRLSTGNPRVFHRSAHPISQYAGLHPYVRERFQRMRAIMASLGFPVIMTSGRRSTRLQASLYADWIAGRRKYPAAPPGRSLHERGLAFDIYTPGEGLAVARELAPMI